MINELSQINFENEKKSRRSVLTVSVFLLIFANLDVRNDVLNIAGLEIVISQDGIVSLLKLVLILALIAFTFVNLEKAPIRIARLMRIRDDKWWEPIDKDIDEFHAQMDPNYDYMQQEREARYSREWDDDARDERFRRKQKRLRVQSYYRPFASFTRIFSRVVWPYLLAMTALLYPDAVFVLAGP